MIHSLNTIRLRYWCSEIKEFCKLNILSLEDLDSFCIWRQDYIYQRNYRVFILNFMYWSLETVRLCLTSQELLFCIGFHINSEILQISKYTLHLTWQTSFKIFISLNFTSFKISLFKLYTALDDFTLNFRLFTIYYLVLT